MSAASWTFFFIYRPKCVFSGSTNQAELCQNCDLKIRPNWPPIFKASIWSRRRGLMVKAPARPLDTRRPRFRSVSIPGADLFLFLGLATPFEAGVLDSSPWLNG